MQIPLQVTFRNFPHSQVIDSQIREHAEKLNEFHNHLMSCRVVVDMPHKHHHQGKLYNVRIDLTVPGNELVVSRNPHEDFFVALRDAFNDAKRQLEEIASKKHRSMSRANHRKFPMQGYVSQLFPERGYGFIETIDGTEIYFNECTVHPSFNQLRIGSEVQFLEEMGEKGLQPASVRIKKKLNSTH